MIKNDFPLLENTDITYLDTAATAQKPQVVIDAVSDYYQSSNANVHRGLYALATKATDVHEDARGRAAQFLNAQREEIVFTKGATEGLNLLAAGIQLDEDSTIILSELEHHANLVPWQQAAKRSGASIKWIPTRSGEINIHVAKELIKDGCDVLAITHLSNVTGAVTPLKELAKLAHEQGALVVADGAQAAAHLQVDVKDLGADAYVFSGHKVYGPSGIGVLYATKDLLEQLPPYQTGGEMIDKVTKDKTTFAQPPHKFEAGTPPLAQAAGLHAALDYLDAHRQESEEAKATRYAYDKLKALPQVNLLCCDDPVGAISFTLKGVHPHDFAQFLDTRDIAIRAGHHCAQPYHESLGLDASARISLGLYSTKDDVDTFMNALQESVLTL